MNNRVIGVSLVALTFLLSLHGANSQIPPFPGFLGTYHPVPKAAIAYPGQGIGSGILVDKVFNFGHAFIVSNMSSVWFKHLWTPENFQQSFLDLSNESDANVVWGMILPPTEGGVVNNPKDNDLWNPSVGPGMIQSAARFSQISRLGNWPHFAGAVIDDFLDNFPRTFSADDVKQIRLALKGHSVFPNGTVDPNSPSLTPHLDLIGVVYDSQLPNFKFKNYGLDGVSFWMHNQLSNYSQFSQEVMKVSQQLPKEAPLYVGFYLKNSWTPVANGASVAALIEGSMDLYKSSVISGVSMFAGPFLSFQNGFFNQSEWSQLNLVTTLQKSYWDMLGGVQCNVLRHGESVPGITVVVRFGNANGPLVTRKTTNSNGMVSWGGLEGQHYVSLPDLKISKLFDVTAGVTSDLSITLP